LNILHQTLFKPSTLRCFCGNYPLALKTRDDYIGTKGGIVRIRTIAGIIPIRTIGGIIPIRTIGGIVSIRTIGGIVSNRTIAGIAGSIKAMGSRSCFLF